MNSKASLNLYELTQGFIKDKQKSKQFVQEIERTIDMNVRSAQQSLATQKDITLLHLELRDQKSELMRTIYVVGLVQFLAIVASVLGIVSFMLR